MADQSNRGPINIPIESLDDDAFPDPGDHEDDVFEIDGDAVPLDGDAYNFNVETPEPAAEVPLSESGAKPEEAEASPDAAATAEPEPEEFDPAVATAAPAAEASQRAPEISREAVFELMQELRQKSEAVVRLSEEKNDLYDRLLRKQAEFENFRKRGEREMQEAYVRARADLLIDLLPVLDNFDLAMQHAENASAEVIHEGMQLIHKQMLDALLRLGLEPIEADGQPFDPELHEAVATETQEDVPDHTVVNVLQRGYRLGDRLLRPARVKVAVQP